MVRLTQQQQNEKTKYGTTIIIWYIVAWAYVGRSVFHETKGTVWRGDRYSYIFFIHVFILVEGGTKNNRQKTQNQTDTIILTSGVLNMNAAYIFYGTSNMKTKHECDA